MNIVAIILTVVLVEIVLAILMGRWLARRAPPPPPPNYPDSANYKRGA